MLEARTAAGGATAVAAVEAESARGVAALACGGQSGEQGANAVESADETHRIGTGRLANGRLIDQHPVTHLIGAEQAVESAGHGCGLAQRAGQRRIQHVADEGGFAAARHASERRHEAQRNLDRQRLEVVLARAFQNEAWRQQTALRIAARGASAR